MCFRCFVEILDNLGTVCFDKENPYQSAKGDDVSVSTSPHILTSEIIVWTPKYGLLFIYRHTSNISHTLVGYRIINHSDVFGASPVGAAPTISSFSTLHLASMDYEKTTAKRDEKHVRVEIWCVLY